MQKILITGASGFIGSALCGRASDAGLQVVAAHRTLPTPVPTKNYIEHRQVGEIHRATDWTDALAGCDVVMHLAGRAHHLREKPSEALALHREVNTQGTLRLVQQAIEAGVKRFVFVSTIGVNGTTTKPGQMFREEGVPAPETAYAISKWEAEKGLQALAVASGMELVIIRPPLVYGWGAPGNFSRLVHLVSRGLPLPLAAIHNQRSFISIRNLTDLLLVCATHPAAANETFLISDGRDFSTPQFLQMIADSMGVKLRLFPIPTLLLKAAAWCLGQSATARSLCDSLCVDTSKIQRLLQWQPKAPRLQSFATPLEH